MSIWSKISISGFLWAALVSAANAGALYCSEDANKNQMSVDDSLVSACLASGLGNINGNNDAFQVLFGDYSLASKSDALNPYSVSYSQNGLAGSWSFDDSFWGSYSAGAIGFKFGTGNQPDSWFVFALNDGVSVNNEAWNFYNNLGKGGGLSHVNLYGIEKPKTEVPEPAGGLLMLLGVAGLLVARRRK